MSLLIDDEMEKERENKRNEEMKRKRERRGASVGCTFALGALTLVPTRLA
jgi:hypothetical protein